MINFAKRAAALALAGAMALSLTACSPKELASDLILKTATLLGFIEEDTGDEEESTDIYAPAGGEITFPDGLQDTSSHWDQQIVDGSLLNVGKCMLNRTAKAVNGKMYIVTCCSFHRQVDSLFNTLVFQSRNLNYLYSKPF